MSSEKTILLVPTDFTKVGDAAINHAVSLAKSLNGEVCLLHIVSKESNLDPTIAKLSHKADLTSELNDIKVDFIARVGNIFDDIGDVAAEIGAKFIVMGTHGLTAFQKITGSHALKVITNSTVPFIVIQEHVKISGYKRIILPLDLSRETKQKLQTTVNLAKKFDSKIYIVTPSLADNLNKLALEKNLEIAKSILEENKLSFEVMSISGASFVENLNKFAQEISADLFAIVNSNDTGIIGSSEAQEIITNEAHIPVLCVNSAVTYSGGMLF
jgi:nucleotide-binding universal stress UspA family protein